MPEPPTENLFTRYVLENCYPLAIVLVLVGLVIGWLALREGRLDRLRLAAVPLVLGVVTAAAGMLVVTPAEHAGVVIRDLVDDVVAGDVTGTMRHFSEDASLQFGTTRNPARDVEGILAVLDRFVGSVTIESNRITRLRAYTTSGETATVHLGNWTETERFGPARSQCVVDVKKTPDGAWKVDRVTVVSVNGQGPPSGW